MTCRSNREALFILLVIFRSKNASPPIHLQLLSVALFTNKRAAFPVIHLSCNKYDGGLYMECVSGDVATLNGTRGFNHKMYGLPLSGKSWYAMLTMGYGFDRER
eukprot:c37523_g1_i1 orf=38-349(+)